MLRWHVASERGILAGMRNDASAELTAQTTCGVVRAEPTAQAVKGSEPACIAPVRGRYVVLEEVGRGGLGRVFRAYDPKLGREVAIKEVHPGTLERRSAERLVIEARAMARLSHPNVVAVYDVEETEEGSVRLVMELVPGITLGAWCRERRRGWSEIGPRFCAAGRGLAAAHDLGLIHRDFKPDNVLMSGDGRIVKVTDFGLARGSGLDLTLAKTYLGALECTPDDARLTLDGRVVGTPRYMSPEQVRGDRLDAASDQFSFCVSAWEALTGAPPIEMAQLARGRYGLPQWPSEQPRRAPREVLNALRRGMSPGAQDRWPSMHALLEALSRTSTKTHRRRIWGLGGLVGVAAGATWVMAAADEESCRKHRGEDDLRQFWSNEASVKLRQRSDSAGAPGVSQMATRLERDLELYVDAFVAARQVSCEHQRAHRDGPRTVDLRTRCFRRARVSFTEALAILSDADVEVLTRGDRLVADLPDPRECLDDEVLSAELEQPLPSESLAVEGVGDLLRRARSLRLAGRMEEARRELAFANAQAAGLRFVPLALDLAQERAAQLDDSGDYISAERVLRDALRLAAETRHGSQVQSLSSSLLHLVGSRLLDPQSAMHYASLSGGASSGEPAREAAHLNHLALVVAKTGDYARAEVHHRRALRLRTEALGASSREVAASLNNLAITLYQQGKYEEAGEAFAGALEIRRHRLGEHHPETVGALGNLATVYFIEGRYDETESIMREVLELSLKIPGNAEGIRVARTNLAGMLIELERFEQAERLIRETIATEEREHGREHPRTLRMRAALGVILDRRGEHAQAADEFSWVLRRQMLLGGESSADVLGVRCNLALALAKLGRSEAAEVEFRAFLDHAGPNERHLAQAQGGLAELLLERGAFDEALRFARLAWAARARMHPYEVAWSAFVLARALDAVEGAAARSEIDELRRAALEKLTAGSNRDTTLAEQIRAWRPSRAG